MFGAIVSFFITYLVFHQIYLTQTSFEWYTNGYWLNGFQLYSFDWYAENITVYARGSDYLIYHDYCRCQID